MPFRLCDSENNLLYTFPSGFHLERYRMAKRSASASKALQHGGDVIGDRKYELLHLSLTGILGSCSLANFESVCSQMKRAIHNEDLRLYDAYKTDQFFLLKALEDADWDFATDGGIADVVVNFLADPFRCDEDLITVGPVGLTESGLTVTGLTVSVLNAGDIETSPMITVGLAGACQTALEIENLNTSRTFYYNGEMIPGDELEIDCENAQVTLNGDVAICHVGEYSSFWNLDAGENVIRVRATGEVGLSVSIEHSFRQKYF